MKNIREIPEHHICTGCGACALVCPVEAVSMAETPAGFLSANVNDTCIGCGLCRRVCPSVAENTGKFISGDLFHGEQIAAFTGYASDDTLRRNGQSGGLVTALLCHLLETGQIDGAAVSRFDPASRRAQAFIARTPEEIFSSAGSCYTQCAMLPVLKDKQERLALTALGCQSEALKLLADIKPELVPEFTIGLICAGQNSGHMIDDICTHAGVCAPVQFRFRDKGAGGWPGEITLKTGENTVTVPNAYRHKIKPIYECHRCLACFDQMNGNADIVCGDPWGLTGKDGTEGCTAVLVRTEKGRRLLEEAQMRGVICLEPLDPEDLFRGQTVDTRHRDKVYAAKAVFAEQGWLYPYDPALLGEETPSKKAMDKNRKKLFYTRAYASAPTAEAAQKFAEKKKQEKPPFWVRLSKRRKRRT